MISNAFERCFFADFLCKLRMDVILADWDMREQFSNKLRYEFVYLPGTV